MFLASLNESKINALGGLSMSLERVNYPRAGGCWRKEGNENTFCLVAPFD